ncbi:hypothetical protein CRG98_027996 [Punica granatum]|uniref:Uncharacterized protein n=1 Tax=Punica granatum TaxID=22663 RepID=A0A2I0J6W7_PUNGR|nr:hypothetical protein CRG98_027996 [Punica granatum]
MKINKAKPRLLFSNNTLEVNRTAFMERFGVAQTDDFGKHLGFPMSLSKRKEKNFSFIVEKVKSELAGWKSQMLSLEGRAALIESVTATISTHIMQCTYLPKTITSEVDKLYRDLLWGSTADKKKLHLVGWDVVTQPKDYGGLGIKKMELRNKALLGGFVAQASEEKAPWAKL